MERNWLREARRRRAPLALPLLAAAVAFFSDVTFAGFRLRQVGAEASLESPKRDVAMGAQMFHNRRLEWMRFGHRKPSHPIFDDYRAQKVWNHNIMDFVSRIKRAYNYHYPTFSYTFKLMFPEGEEEAATEDEIRDYFTTDEYAPDGVVTNFKTEMDNRTYAFVHFPNNAIARKVWSEKKSGGTLGKATNYKLKWADDNMWIRARDGVTDHWHWRKQVWGKKAYGNGWLPGWGEGEHVGEGWVRTHPVYPQ